ncbi:hypothetical protein HPJ99_11115 [Anoxybacillus flavithermus]|uniref:hypothetical protein n=1 Tax=Anoxybacillus flavithermus TaxID=33934 RepID=UPI001868D497|nr:hypothetical protein [Anoxybacillus flavithermus]MBE2908696.1 hypothetical protein [Anoxybacillus flavithermus]MBE2911369.1 hypothetical protein [Anoxybacillus flavithermus]MBE2935733.1 hypothetical protein [Anoxybacillus flavithermus]
MNNRIVFIFILIACLLVPISNIKAITNLTATSSNKTVTQPKVNKLSNAKKSYYDIVNKAIDKYGILTKDEGLHDENKGLAYVELIDFDKNKTPELYIIYRNTADGSYSSYIEEIWSYINGKAVKVHSQEFDDGGLISDAARSIATTSSNTYLIESGQYSAGSRGDYPDGSEYAFWHVFSTLKNNKIVRVAEAHKSEVDLDSGHITVYKIVQNGKERKVSKSEYEKLLRQFNFDKRKMIINSDLGAKSLAFSVSNNAQKINKFLQQLSKDIKETKNKGSNSENLYKKMTLKEKKELLKLLFYFSHSDKVDVSNNKTSDKDIAFFLYMASNYYYITDEELKPDSKKKPIPAEHYAKFIPYSKKTFDGFTRRLFGKSLSAKNYSHKDYGEIIIYKNNTFYMKKHEGDLPISIYFPQIEKIYSLGKNVFRVEFMVYNYDPSEAEENIDGKFIYNPMETWTAEQKYSRAISKAKAGYAVMKKVKLNGKSQWNVVKYVVNKKY